MAIRQLPVVAVRKNLPAAAAAPPGPDSAIVQVAAPTSRLLRIAPVSEEQIMNYVAERLLSLPRSY